MEKKDNLKKILICVLTADLITTTAAAINCSIRIKKRNRAVNHKPEIKADINIPNPIIPGNTPSFVEKVIRAFCKHNGFRIIPAKIEDSVNKTGYDFWYYDNDKDATLSVYCEDQKTLEFEFRKGSLTTELKITIVSDGEEDEDKVIRTEITKSNYTKENCEYYSRSYTHNSFAEALSTPEFRFLKEAFDFRLVPSVEYNNN